MRKHKREAREKKVKKTAGEQSAQPVPKLLDAKKFHGIIPSFSKITLEEMRSWRDDR